MKRVLVTGAAGFIGRHCLRPLLDRNFEVRAITSRPLKLQNDGVEWHRADLFDVGELRNVLEDLRPDHLLHLAWCTEPGVYWTSPENFRWVQASLELFRAFSECGGKRLVTVGTCAEYDWRFGICAEDVTPLHPTTIYGSCKKALSELTRAYSSQAGLSSAWARMFFLYGPYEDKTRLVPSVIQALLSGEEAACTHGNQIRDFLYVEDAADALVTLLDSDVTGELNIATGKPLMIKEMVQAIGQKLNQIDLIHLGARQAPEGEPGVLLADISRLKSELKWQSKYSLDATRDR